jgi:exonuclease VII small subunit
MKKILPLLLSFSLFLLAAFPVLAKSTVQTVRMDSENASPTGLQQRQDRSAQWMEQRCEVIEKRIEVQVARYESNAQQHTARYERMMARLNALVERLQADSVDTTELEAAIVVLDEKIQLFAHNAASYVESLRATQGFACGESEGDFREALTESRSLLQILRENVLDIRTYWQETLRPLITALVSTDTEE